MGGEGEGVYCGGRTERVEDEDGLRLQSPSWRLMENRPAAGCELKYHPWPSFAVGEASSP